MDYRTANKSLIFIVAALFSFYNLMQLALFNIIGTHIQADFQLSSTQLGFISASFLWGNALALLPIGFCLERYSVRYIGLIFLTLTSAASLLLAFTHAIWFICLLRFIQGCASAASLLIGMRLAVQLFDENRNFAVGFLVAIALLGGVVGNYGVAIFVALLSWRAALFIVGCLGILLLGAMYRYLHINAVKSFYNIKAVLVKSDVIIAGLYLGLMNAPVFILATLWGNYYLTQLYHLTANNGAVLSSWIFIGVIVGSLVWGRIFDQLKNKIKLLYIITGLTFLSSLTAFTWKTASLLELIFMFMLLGLLSSSQNIAYAILSENNSNAPSAATSMASLIANGIGALSQIFFGMLLQFVTLRKMPSEIPGVILSLLFILSLLLIPYFIKPVAKAARNLSSLAL